MVCSQLLQEAMEKTMWDMNIKPLLLLYLQVTL